MCLETHTKDTPPFVIQPIHNIRLYLPLIARHRLAERKTRVTPKVLLADDNVINQKVGVRMLETLGYLVDVAANGQEAVEALGRINYAAVLMDCQMPEMDGFAATEEIRRRETLNVKREAKDASHDTLHEGRGTPRMPIIAMTASLLLEDRTRCFDAGMDDYISKPVHSKVLAEVLARWVAPGIGKAEKTGKAEGILDGHRAEIL